MSDPAHDAEAAEGETSSKPVTMYDPAFWAAHPDVFREALTKSGFKLAPQKPHLRPSQVIRELAELPLTFTIQTLTTVFPMMKTDHHTRLTLTVEEAAQVLGISRAFAYEAVRRGEIPSIKIGRRVPGSARGDPATRGGGAPRP